MFRLISFYFFLTVLFDYSYGRYMADYQYIETVQSFYKIHSTYSTGEDAKQICEAEGATLFYPKSEVEFNAVNTLLKEAEWTQHGIWVDMPLSLAEIYFKEFFISADFIGNSGLYKCLVLSYRGDLRNEHCATKKPFMCKKTKESSEITSSTTMGSLLSEVHSKGSLNNLKNNGGPIRVECLVLSYSHLSDERNVTKKPFLYKITKESEKEVTSPSSTLTDKQREQNFFRTDYHFIKSLENFYKVITTPMTWLDAKQRCDWEGTTLYYPTSEAEANAVHTYLEEEYNLYERVINFSGFWVGITSMLSEGILLTTDGLPLNEVYSKWNQGEPNNIGKDENCVEIIGTALNDVNCVDTNPFICKKTLASLEWNTACQMPYADYTYNETLGKCYKLHTYPKTWTEAYATCSSELSYLAVIDSQDEVDYLVDTLASGMVGNIDEVAYLGFHNKFGHSWRTVKDTPLKNTEYLVWDRVPNDYRDFEACGSINRHGKLNAVACNERRFFICEHNVAMPGMPDIV